MTPDRDGGETLPSSMDCWTVAGRPGAERRLDAQTRQVPSPAADEVVVAVSVCGVCRTDLHLADGEEFLRLAERVRVRARVTTYPFATTDQALDDLAACRFDGVAVVDLAR